MFGVAGWHADTLITSNAQLGTMAAVLRGNLMRNIFIASILAFGTILSVPAFAAGGETLYRQVESSSGAILPYAIHLPPEYDPDADYPVLLGPGDGEKGSDPGFYWQDEPHIEGWIIVDAQIWDSATKRELDALLDAVAAEVNVEGGKFHAVCWSANSAGIFSLITKHANRFHSITGMAGNPGRLSSADIDALQTVKVQFVVGENDPYWQRSARDAYEKLIAGGVDSVFEIVPNGKHVMTDLIGAPFIQKLEKLR
jgi:dienelactone hydrolase